MKQENKGFTLIELLVVIAIIGILAGIVLTSLSGAREKAKDAQVQANLSGFRTAAELVFAKDGNYLNVCSANETKPYVDAATKDNLGQDCNFTTTTGQAYAYEVVLPSDKANSSWCVDSTGFSGKTPKGSLSGNKTFCPH